MPHLYDTTIDTIVKNGINSSGTLMFISWITCIKEGFIYNYE
jgi:hypothetical protein